MDLPVDEVEIFDGDGGLVLESGSEGSESKMVDEEGTGGDVLHLDLEVLLVFGEDEVLRDGEGLLGFDLVAFGELAEDFFGFGVDAEVGPDERRLHTEVGSLAFEVFVEGFGGVLGLDFDSGW